MEVHLGKFLCWEDGAQFQCDVGLILSSFKGSAFESNDAKCAARGLHVLGRKFNQLSYIFSGFNLVLLLPFWVHSKQFWWSMVGANVFLVNQTFSDEKSCRPHFVIIFLQMP